MNRDSIPPVVLATSVVLLLATFWIYVRLVLFAELALPLTFVIPMLVCVWTRRSWHVWLMAVVFLAAALTKYLVVLPPDTFTPAHGRLFLGTTLFNITLGAIVIELLVRLRNRLDRQNARLTAQNAELESQAEELAHQNEEINAQAEELAQQNEQIESQAEELVRQNEELHDSAVRLTHREEVLQALLESTRTPETGRAALLGLARRSLAILGSPAECVAVLRIQQDGLVLKTQASVDGGPQVPDGWPIKGSIAAVVLAQDRTAYVSDLAAEPALAAPFGIDGRIRSVLATPMHVAGAQYGLVVACTRQPGAWADEQFRVLEWIAAQCGLIAEALRWQNALADRAREIAAANEAKDQFLAMLSHELRTPLMPVLAAAGVLEADGRLPEDAREDIAMIRRNVAIQSRLVDDLLDVTKLGRGKLDVELQPVGLAALLRETATIVGPDLDAKSQKLILELGAAGTRQVRGDGARLQQVFWNLLRNANKFSPVGGQIRMTTRVHAAPSPRMIVEVADDGVGIDPADLGRIFLPFEQVTSRRKTGSGEGGLGLGLAIAKAIIELHHGTIAVRSDGRGRGARFIVELPLLPESPEAPKIRPAISGPRKLPPHDQLSLSILLVEDHRDTGRVLARLLRHSGYKVEHAETAGAALELFARQRFDLLISDVGLPDESGIELMKKLRAQRPDLVGICLSGFGMESDLETCRQAGFAEHLTKPVDMQRLHAAIRRTCQQFVGKNGSE